MDGDESGEGRDGEDGDGASDVVALEVAGFLEVFLHVAKGD